MEKKKFLEDIKNGNLSIEEGIKYLDSFDYEDINIAKIDFQRKKRRGFGETIFCENKNIDQLIKIFTTFINRKEDILGTRISEEKASALMKKFPDLKYNKIGETIYYKFKDEEKIGNISICTGGTADMKVFEEAKTTAEFFGNKVTPFIDIGVAGLSRLLNSVEEINKGNVIIVIAGMEGALPTVMAGLVNKPIIAVPTSVGYGVGEKGFSALRSMLSSCAEGISVVNIDNGFGAAYQGAQINKLVEGK